MKISASASLLALLGVSGVGAFRPASIPASAFRSSGSALSAVKSPQGDHGAYRPNPTAAFAAAAASGLAAWTLASQVAFAGMLPVNSVAPVFSEQSYSSVVVAVETMDFSMPSYSDALEGSTKSIKASDGAPAFNPFGDFKPDFKNKEEAFPAPPAPAPAPMEMPKMPDFKVPEFKAPEFKAPDVKVPEFKAPDFDIPEIKMPEFQAPSFSMPKFDMPKIDMPKFDMPKIDMPKFDIPSSSGGDYDLDLPKAPKVDMPKFDMPKIDMPKFDMPKFDRPKIDMPKFDIPSSSGDGYDLDLPKAPKVDMPKIDLPKIDLPKLPAFSNPFGGGSDSSSSDVLFEPREVRDEKARQARQVYLDADNDAKVIEQQAREVRAVANDKKKLAAEAKDLACADRLGGKWICLRNPFVAGF